jgi:hypothetical protein
VETAEVEPVDLAEGGQLNVVWALPRSLTVDQLRREPSPAQGAF